MCRCVRLWATLLCYSLQAAIMFCFFFFVLPSFIVYFILLVSVKRIYCRVKRVNAMTIRNCNCVHIRQSASDWKQLLWIWWLCIGWFSFLVNYICSACRRQWRNGMGHTSSARRHPFFSLPSASAPANRSSITAERTFVKRLLHFRWQAFCWWHLFHITSSLPSLSSS